MQVVAKLMMTKIIKKRLTLVIVQIWELNSHSNYLLQNNNANVTKAGFSYCFVIDHVIKIRS
jgi:hypothetical protein